MMKKQQQRNKPKILIALSGGVDSTWAALSLQQAGWETVGVHFLLPDLQATQESRRRKQSTQARVKKLTKQLGMRLKVIDLGREFRQEVIDYTIQEYREGRTPNPCVVCNQKVKFKYLAATADKLGIRKIATGHYVRKAQEEMGQGKSRRRFWLVQEALDASRDQSYFLARLDSATLARCEFPLGDWSKQEVERQARAAGLWEGELQESRGLCFVQGDLLDQLGAIVKEKKGEIRDQQNRVIGQHDGLLKYTLGQRKGVKIGGAGPYFVTGKDYRRNRLLVSNIGDEPKLFQDCLRVQTRGWMDAGRKEFMRQYWERVRPAVGIGVKIRYGQKKVAVQELVWKDSGVVKIVLKEKLRAATEGQIAVFYSQEGLVLGGGPII